MAKPPGRPTPIPPYGTPGYEIRDESARAFAKSILQPTQAFLVTCSDADQYVDYPIAVFATQDAAQAQADTENSTATRQRRRQHYTVEPIDYQP